MRTRMGLPLLIVVALLAPAAAGCGGNDGEAGGSEGLSVDLGEQNGSGQTGTATFTADGEKTKVVIDLSNPPGDPQPAHIHKGTCDNLNPQPEYPLTNVEGGKSETTVNAPLSELQDEDYAVNIHKSEADVKTYVACGDIPKS